MHPAVESNMESRILQLCCGVILLVLLQVYHVQSDAEISVRFIKYINPKGVGSNGHCCDGKWGICQSNGCDHKFTVCMGNYSSPNNTKDCPLGKFQSGQIKNQNNNTFSRTIADLKNPLLFNVTGRLPDGIALKVDVYDSDKGTSISDYVDFLIYRAGTKVGQKYTLTIPGTTPAGTTLYAEMNIRCVNKTVGARCESKAPKCPPPGPRDHYKCDKYSGKKICTDGYMGKNCDLPPRGTPSGPAGPAGRPSGPSRPNSFPGGVPSGPGNNGRPSPGSYPSGPAPGPSVPGVPSPNRPGLPSPARPGPAPAPGIPSPTGGRPSGPPACTPPRSYDHYVCDPRTGQKVCKDGYTGIHCEVPPNPPNSPTCESPRAWDHYTCDPATGRKICKDGYTGEHCQIPPAPVPNIPNCEPPRAWDHYVCDPHTGRKICKDGYTGVHCEVPPRSNPVSPNCKPPTAWDHYKCDPVTGRPVCDPGWTGTECNVRSGSGGSIYRPSSSGGSSFNPGTSRLCPTPRIGDHYICDSTFTRKICTDGYSGTNCDIRPSGPSFPSSSGGSSRGSSRRPVDPPVAPSPGNPAQRVNRPTFPSYIGRKADCDRIAELERDYRGVSGVFDIQPSGVSRPFPVYCIMTTDGRGWTQIQRREERGTTNFNRRWGEYKDGFGSVGRHAEEWIGLDNLHALTSQRSYKLRIDMQGDDMRWRHAIYDRFSVDGERDNYRLHVSGYDPTSTAGDALQGGATAMHNGMAFSTPDRDNDRDRNTNCAQKFESGWWFNACFFSNLNGPTQRLSSCDRSNGKCIAWYANNRSTVKAVRMAILPK